MIDLIKIILKEQLKKINEDFYSFVQSYLDNFLKFPFEFSIHKKLPYHYFPSQPGSTYSSTWFHERLGVLVPSEFYVIIIPKISMSEWFSCKYNQGYIEPFVQDRRTFNYLSSTNENLFNPNVVVQVLNSNFQYGWDNPDSYEYYKFKTSFYIDYNTQQSNFLFQLNEDIKKIHENFFSASHVYADKLCMKEITVEYVSPNYKIKETEKYKELIQSKYPNFNFIFKRISSSNFISLTWNPNDPNNWSEEKKEDEKIKKFEEFIKLARIKYGKKYEYDYDNFYNMDTLMSVFCTKHQKYFDVIPNLHLKGKRCPLDVESSGENLVRAILENYNVPFLQYHKIEGCVSEKNGKCYLLTFDFYLPQKKTVIEYDGGQHFSPVSKFGGEKTFERTILLDSIKNDFCKKNNIKMIRIPYTMSPEEIETYLLMELGITD